MDDNKGFLLNKEETFDNQVYTLDEIKDILKLEEILLIIY